MLVNKSKSSTRTLLVLAALAIAVSACAGKKKAKAGVGADGQAKTAQVDMTRPPVTIGAEREIVVENNPDETISFEEWKRRQGVDEQTSQESPAPQP